MKIIIDESLGLPKDWLLENDILIRELRIKKESSFNDAFEKSLNQFPPRRLRVQKEEFQHEIELFEGYCDSYGDVLYIYDPFVTNGARLKRLSNWGYPNQRLFLHNGARNLAFTVFLLKELKLRSLEEVYHRSLHTQQAKFTITNNLKYHTPSHYLRLKEEKKKKYFLVDGTSNEKIGSGDKVSLLDTVLTNSPIGKVYLASRTPLPSLKEDTHFLLLENVSLPVSSDKIDIFIKSV